jgi:hypothetical protein
VLTHIRANRADLNVHGSFLWQRDRQFGTHRNTHVSQADFELANDLVEVLKPFYNITLQLLTGASACVAEVVVMIDQITAGLSAVIANDDGKYPPALQNACRAGLWITNKYYSLTDCSPIYRIAMGKFLCHLKIFSFQLTSLEFKLIKSFELNL